MTLEEAGGATLMRSRMRFASREDRDAMIDSGLETGANESYERWTHTSRR